MPDESIITPTSRKILQKKLSKLKKKELQVVKYLYGLEDGVAYTAAEISKKMHLTTERIRQIKEKAFKKLNIKNDDLISKFARSK